ncbi:MAG: glutaredoxin domain-containing protein [Myxococcota bacterium]
MTGADVVIYTSRTCGYCHAAKRLLERKGVAFREVATEGRADLRRWLVEASGQTTVPQVFINGASIGGYSELADMDDEGQLEDRLSTGPAVDTPSLPT